MERTFLVWFQLGQSISWIVLTEYDKSTGDGALVDIFTTTFQDFRDACDG